MHIYIKIQHIYTYISYDGASEEQDVMAAGEHLADHPKARKCRITASDIKTVADLLRVVGIYLQELLCKALSTYPMPPS